ncbi:NAD-dependent epimerase/dehydratase family protein [Janibacter sp. G56]|uniref:NAD-dependent epimerase/dehydratase family protein n=1 Tax=Janibacter sp. G56 TaxID=3418717 RepID=UPI003CFF8649
MTSRVLVLGGTAWLGRAVVRAALSRGHEVTAFARGESGTVPEGATFVPGDREQPASYDELGGGEWDLVVDLARQPGQVRSALAALSPRALHWAFISSCSVYADQSRPDADERARRLRPVAGDVIGPEDYGAGKVACEIACESARGKDVLLVRSGLIVGRGDPSDRFGYWPSRFALATEDGGPVLVPGASAQHFQAIHVDDLAAWIVEAGLRGVTGPFNTSGPVTTLADLLDTSARVAGFTGERVALGDEALLAAGIAETMGPDSMPMWVHDAEWAGFFARDVSAARREGLTCRPLAESVADALGWERHLGLARTGRRTGLDRARELAIVEGRSASRGA